MMSRLLLSSIPCLTCGVLISKALKFEPFFFPDEQFGEFRQVKKQKKRFII